MLQYTTQYEPNGLYYENCLSMAANDRYFFHDSECDMKMAVLCQTDTLDVPTTVYTSPPITDFPPTNVSGDMMQMVDDWIHSNAEQDKEQGEETSVKGTKFWKNKYISSSVYYMESRDTLEDCS